VLGSTVTGNIGELVGIASTGIGLSVIIITGDAPGGSTDSSGVGIADPAGEEDGCSTGATTTGPGRLGLVGDGAPDDSIDLKVVGTIDVPIDGLGAVSVGINMLSDGSSGVGSSTIGLKLVFGLKLGLRVGGMKPGVPGGCKLTVTTKLLSIRSSADSPWVVLHSNWQNLIQILRLLLQPKPQSQPPIWQPATAIHLVGSIFFFDWDVVVSESHQQ
jgi:hypothetical protein